VKKNHTGRNLAVLAVIMAIAVAAVGLPLLLQQEQTFVMVVHVYDPTRGNPRPQTLTDLTEQQLVTNVTVTVPGANPATRVTPTGIIAYDQLPARTYQITVTKDGYKSNVLTYVLVPNCIGRTPDGQCHPLVSMISET